jgi:4-diphosphocytidyl-2-C-methyl-D-erythritol kinase
MAGCAGAGLPPPAAVVDRARGAATYSASLRVRLDGPEFRGRARVLVGFRRPDSLRIELPGPAGARLVAVARQGRLEAAFPPERAVYRAPATAEELERLLGVSLAPEELIDLLVGVPSPRLRGYRARWGPELPREIEALLPDGSRFRARVEDPRTGLALPDAAFARPGGGAAALGDAMTGRLEVRSFAKVNLGLEVLGPRQDGYHELRTLFQSIELHDDVVVRSGGKQVVVRCGHPLVPDDDSNLAARAALALKRHADVSAGVHIDITKRIPVGGGLGGGSSNAAAVLLALDHLWRLGLGPAGLHPLARRLGADVPYFLVGGTALGLARGDEVYPLRRQLAGHLVLADPGGPVSTAAVFRRIDACLTPRENSNSIFYFISRDLEEGAYRLLTNDLEGAALEEAPALKGAVARIRGVLVREGAMLAALSGSGSTYFGLFEDGDGARRALAGLAHAGFSAIRARTLSLDQYRRHWTRSLTR